MAKAAGQTFPDFTPPEGETHDQVTSVSSSRLSLSFKLFCDVLTLGFYYK